jgi:hypothetical protein
VAGTADPSASTQSARRSDADSWQRNVSVESREILLNKAAIAINQDSLGQMGLRLTPSSAAPQQARTRRISSSKE